MDSPKLACAAEHILSKFGAYSAQTAGAEAAFVSAVFDRQALVPLGAAVSDEARKNTASLALVIPISTTLAEDKTLAVKIEVAESEDNSTYDAYADLKVSTVIATGGSGGSTETPIIQYNLKLAGYKRYVKFRITPAFTATGTDTAGISVAMVDTGNQQYLVSDDGWNLN